MNVVLERLWPGATVVCVGSGMSLKAEDLALVRGRARVIVVNDAYKLAPWADVLYACDSKWWGWHKDALQFAGMKLTLDGPHCCRQVPAVRHAGRDGLELDPERGIRDGHHSGYQAINVAVQLGASRIVLLGYDMHGGHFFGKHPDGTVPPHQLCLRAFDTLVGPLKSAGIEVINCTRKTALAVFPNRRLEDVFPAEEAVA